MTDSAFYRPNIAIFAGSQKEYAREEFVREHVLTHIIAGEVRYTLADRETVEGPGATLLFRRDLLFKCLKRPAADGKPFVVVNFVLEREFLRQYAAGHGLKMKRADQHHAGVLRIEPRVALRGLFKSLYPYIESGTKMSEAMIRHKLEEAILALVEEEHSMQDWLLDLDAQEKIDLAVFMQQHYKFNVPVTKFAELTGRSLSTFQRDFQKHFGTNAGKWLLKRRLQAAHEALVERNATPGDIYLDMGFEDLSHFSRSFKKEFGVSPSGVRRGNAHLG